MVAALERQTAPLKNPHESSVIIVGAGPVGIYCAHQLAEKQPETPMTIFGGECWQPYNRVKLTDFLSGSTKESSLYKNLELPNTPYIVSHWNNPIVEIDTENHCVIDSYDEVHYYSELVLALGSKPRVPSIDGVDLQNVFTFRDMQEAQALIGRQVSSRRTVVIGGGLLGIEAAHAMQRFNTEVICIEHSSRLMFNQLDDHATAFVERYLASIDIEVHTSQRVKKIHGTTKVESIELADGEIIECDTVILSTGIQPNIELARNAGIHVGNGIKVDDHLLTNKPHVYAIGECAEHREKTYGIVAPGYEQASVLANRLDGIDARYVGSTSATNLKVLDYPVFSMGENGDYVSSSYEYIYRDIKNNVYRKLVIFNGRLIGAISTGPWKAKNRIQEAVAKQRHIWPWQRKHFVLHGELWKDKEEQSIAEWPANATVCNCMGITRGTLSNSIKAGNVTTESLCKATGASSVCGSCQPLIHELTQSDAPRPAVRMSFLISALAIASIIASFLLFVLPAMPYAGSVQSSWQLDDLWRISLNKQITGYVLLALSVLIALLSFRKRIKRFSFGSFASWRLAHIAIGTLIFAVIFLHTGFRLGSGLNLVLMLTFSGLLLVGAVASVILSKEHLIPTMLASKLRRTSVWTHILLFWPIPTLLGFHIFKSYYF